MKIGDLVKHQLQFLEPPYPDEQDNQVGIILEIEKWVDSGAPDRNFGVHVKVLWGDGTISSVEECDLTHVDDKKYLIE